MKILFRAVSTAAVITALIAPRVLAQDATPAPITPTPAVPAPITPPVIAPAETPATPAVPATNTPAKKAMPKKTTAAKPAAKKTEPKIETKSEPVLSPEPGVAKQNNVNVRGQASINSEVVAHLKKGDAVMVLEEVTLKKPKQDEPSRWYRIAFPTQAGVWVNANFVDTANNTVKASRLNMRGGPGENYSVLGRLEKGAAVKPLDTKNGWIKIEPPTNSFAYVAAHLIERQPAAAIAATTPKTEPVPTPVPATTATVPSNPPPAVAEVTPVVPPVTAPATTPATTPTPAPAETTTPATPVPAVTPAPAEATTNAPIETVRKIVSREGILKGSASIQAPTYFELRSLDTGKAIDYVYSPSTNLMLKEFKGQRVIVTGEEILDERWQHTPVIIADELQVVR